MSEFDKIVYRNEKGEFHVYGIYNQVSYKTEPQWIASYPISHFHMMKNDFPRAKKAVCELQN